jgi:hypothetical protein
VLACIFFIQNMLLCSLIVLVINHGYRYVHQLNITIIMQYIIDLYVCIFFVLIGPV